MFLNKNLFQLFLLLFFLFGCGPNKQISKENIPDQKESFQQIAEKNFGKNVDYKLNPNKNYVLCEKATSDLLRDPNQLIEFFVYDIQKEKIIYRDKISNAKLSWYNNTQLQIINQKGYTTNSEDNGKWIYIFDLKTKKRVTLKNHNNK